MFIRKSDCLKVIAGLAIATLVSGCADYMNRRDTVTLGSGNAMEANIGIHTITPFPAAAAHTYIPGDGRAVLTAQGRYLTPGDPDVVIQSGASGSAEVQ
ncbi:hypothetical protein [Roseibium salinum]|uniref:Uncharacterized protein n=1 Tax=Roseibium salinum TaxID=1604349 RepID=A0ABT3R9A4_9HYPH|nr:hypothetical protein [Roseibium sp. DSM 29163]MCX2725651.1 hypothetical protein [Roseibium sp. DSM 29163]